VAERRIGAALKELWRVCRGGLMMGSVTSDLTPGVLDRYDLLRGVRRLATWWEWSEDLLNSGFELAIQDTSLLDRLWQKTVAAGGNIGLRCNKSETLLYRFVRKVPEEAVVVKIRASGRR
jgi:hypothetical protein